MIIKAWTRQRIAHDEHKAENLMLHIKKLLGSEFKVRTRSYLAEHKKVLFSMSKNLIYEAYSHVPTYNEIGKIDDVVRSFVEKTLGGLSLRNVEVGENGVHVLTDGVMDFEAAIA